MARVFAGQIGEMVFEFEVDALDRATEVVVTHARAARPRVTLLEDGSEPEAKVPLEDGRGSTFALPRARRLTREVIVHRRFGPSTALRLPPCIFYEREWER